MNNPIELWYSPSDFSPCYRVRVTGDEVELLEIRDIDPEYSESKNIPIEQHYVEYIQCPEVKKEIIERVPFVMRRQLKYRIRN